MQGCAHGQTDAQIRCAHVHEVAIGVTPGEGGRLIEIDGGGVGYWEPREVDKE